MSQQLSQEDAIVAAAWHLPPEDQGAGLGENPEMPAKIVDLVDQKGLQTILPVLMLTSRFPDRQQPADEGLRRRNYVLPCLLRSIRGSND
jgi:hypothetical protein